MGDRHPPPAFGPAATVAGSIHQAELPEGRVIANGVAFQGAGQFKFALISSMANLEILSWNTAQNRLIKAPNRSGELRWEQLSYGALDWPPPLAHS